MDNIITSYKTLSKICKVSLEFQIIRDTEFYINKLYQLIDIIGSTPSFNEKDNKEIARTFLEFFNSIPRAYFNEGNPNNGSYLFQNIKIIGDDTIVLETYHTISDENIKYIKSLVNEYGKRVNADEHSVERIELAPNFYKTYIKFWWD